MSKRPNRIPQAPTPAPALMPNPHHRRQKNPGSGVGHTATGRAARGVGQVSRFSADIEAH
jgi:hypothetical protein